MTIIQTSKCESRWNRYKNRILYAIYDVGGILSCIIGKPEFYSAHRGEQTFSESLLGDQPKEYIVNSNLLRAETSVLLGTDYVTFQSFQ
jgi:hypothetical protein